MDTVNICMGWNHVLKKWRRDWIHNRQSCNEWGVFPVWYHQSLVQTFSNSPTFRVQPYEGPTNKGTTEQQNAQGTTPKTKQNPSKIMVSRQAPPAWSQNTQPSHEVHVGSTADRHQGTTLHRGVLHGIAFQPSGGQGTRGFQNHTLGKNKKPVCRSSIGNPFWCFLFLGRMFFDGFGLSTPQSDQHIGSKRVVHPSHGCPWRSPWWLHRSHPLRSSLRMSSKGNHEVEKRGKIKQKRWKTNMKKNKKTPPLYPKKHTKKAAKLKTTKTNPPTLHRHRTVETVIISS